LRAGNTIETTYNNLNRGSPELAQQFLREALASSRPGRRG
jgi:hypothetical protein